MMARTLEAVAKTKKLISYRYESLSTGGKLVKGTIKATGEIEAERLLIERGYTPMTVEIVPSMFSLEEALPSLFKIKPRDVIIFSRQLATLLRAGISLLPSMEILQGQMASGRTFKKMLETIVNDLSTGGSFSQAVAKHPTAFNEVYLRTITVGEQTGNMELVLNGMADYMEQQSAMAKKVGGALRYPMIVMGAGLVVVVILMTVVMPQLMNMFASMGVDLPLPTKILIGVSNFITTYPLYLFVALVVLVVAVLWLVKRPSGRRLLDRVRLNAPLIGPPALLGELARFCRTMSVLMDAGLSLQEIMELSVQSSSNSVIRNALSQVNERLVLGEGLSDPMSRIDIFPPLLVQMASVGEESNTLGFTMGVVADFYETTAEEKTAAMVGMISPLSTAFIGLLVGFIAISILMPMYTLTGSF
ncbi:type II secretion system F family protein [Chloroflexota bacterium]